MASKALAATTDKSLSAVTLTKKTVRAACLLESRDICDAAGFVTC